MASFSAGTTFTDGVANDVTAAKLGALVNNATPTSGLIQDRTAETVTATNDTLLIGDASDSNNLKRITVANFAQTLPTAKITTGTIDTATLGTTTGTAATFTSGTLTTGVIPTGTFGTTTSTAATITTGTIPTLVATTLVTTGTGTASAPAIVPTGDTNTGIFFPAADTIAFSEGGAEAMRIDSSGQVGVGVTPSGWGASEYKAIQVGIGGSISGRVSGGDQDKVNVAANIYNDGTVFKYIASDEATIYQQTNGIHTFSNAPSGTAGNTATFTERLRIDSSGRVGIGTTGPQKELQINATEPTIRLEESSGGSKRLELSINSSAEAKIFANQSGGTLILGTVATERLRIDSSGVFYVNKTSTNTVSQSIISGGTANALECETSSSASYPFLAINTATSGSNRFVYFGTEAGGSSQRGFIDYNRGSNVTRYSTTSDARLKNIIGDSSGEESISILKNTKIRDYTWKEDKSAKVNVGVIAQELHNVFKGAVSVGNQITRKDSNGNDVIDEEPWGVDKTAFTFHLISGWQSHEKIIQELKLENNSLKARLEALEAA